MKRSIDQVSSDRPETVEEVREWIRRVELFEQVNWEIDIPTYGAVSHLLDDDFVWDWSPACTAQYNAVVELTGVRHVHPHDRAVRPISQYAPPNACNTRPSSPTVVGRPPSVLLTPSDSEDSTEGDCSCDEEDCSKHALAWVLFDDP